MIESIFSFICEHANHAHWIIFILLLLSGLCLPISEDILVLGGGALASTCIPHHTFRMYFWIFLGSALSGWETYWIGRSLGPYLDRLPFVKKIATTGNLKTLSDYYNRFGIFTFILGRFCPGGVRNGLFLSSGMAKIPFHWFAIRDAFACLISTLTLFHIGYFLGLNIATLNYYVKIYRDAVLSVLAIVVLLALGYFWFIYKKKE